MIHMIQELFGQTLSLSEPKQRSFIGRGLAPSALFLAIGSSAALIIANMRQDWWVPVLYLTNLKVAIDQ
jgi:hypothetical protein